MNRGKKRIYKRDRRDFPKTRGIIFLFCGKLTSGNIAKRPMWSAFSKLSAVMKRKPSLASHLT